MSRKPYETLSILWKAFSPYYWQILLLSVLGFLSSMLSAFGIGAVIPLLAFFTNNDVASNGITKGIQYIFSLLHVTYSLPILLVFLVSIFFLRAAILLIFGAIGAYIRYDYKNRTIKNILSAMITSQWPFFLRQKIGFMQETILRNTDESAKALASLSQMILSFSGVIVLSIFAFSLTPTITILMAIAGVCIMFLFRPLVRRTRVVGKLLVGQGKVLAQYLSEHIVGMKSVKIAGVEEQVIARGDGYFNALKILEVKKALLSTISSVITEPVSIIFVAGVLAYNYNSPEFNFAVFAATIFLVQRIFIYLESGQGAWYFINETIYHTAHILAFRDELMNHRESVDRGTPFSFCDKIVFHDVSFGYDDARLILNKLSFHITKGEIVGIVGPSGTGKTSIADLIMRLFSQYKGSITIDGASIQKTNLIEWRKNIGYVSQDIFLLNVSLYENIRFYDDAIQMSDVVAAAQLANIYDTIQGLPEKFDTIVGDRGVMLSAGQRQRIVLARALARHPQILLLDEATSALDNESEIAIQESIRALKGSMTVIMIAHRLSTLTDADRVIAIDGGRVIEEGTPQKLLENPTSYFYAMYHAKDSG
jgi:ABC-type multidrug transport system fused ATPase/permease subunit